MQQKKIWMLFLIIGGLISFYMTSCDSNTTVEIVEHAQFTYKNSMKTKVSLVLYSAYKEKYVLKEDIASGDSLSLTVRGRPGARPFRGVGNSDIEGDSCVIEFADNKCVSYINYKERYGLFWILDYTPLQPVDIGIGKRVRALLYSIDSTDYKLAKPCK